ncbi:MAG: type II secretion system protein [Deltaproteobacteria bacterium]|nr:type II secretion system protein [Deltaproteobacteria bacterium]
MKAHQTVVCRQAGFTLIEMIVTIIVAAILGSMFLQIMGTNLTGSVEPLLRVQDQFVVKEVMERITADYDVLRYGNPTPLGTLKGRIGNAGTEVVGGDYGSYTVEYNDYIIFNDGDGDGDYEEFHDGGSGGYAILKVTVSSSDERLTSLFTK